MSGTDIAATSAVDEQPDDTSPVPSFKENWPWVVGGLAVVLVLGILTFVLTDGVPRWTEGTGFGTIADSIEFPVYAIILGLLGNAILSATKLREKLSPGFRTEFLIKTGLVLLGASINFAIIVRAAGPAILQAILLISIVFFSTWWVSGKLGLDDRLRALLSTAVSICGVSAAIAAAGAVKAKREHLAYTASLVILFALPAIFVLPWLAGVLGLSPAVTGAWIGGNIDTTAAVTAAGTLAGEQPLQIAAIVKSTQNALLGVAAILLTVYFAYKVERTEGAPRPTARAFWDRFPKFVLGFLVASIVATIYSSAVPSDVSKAAIGVANNLRTWFLTFAFVSIGLEFNIKAIREAGWRPIVVFVIATVVNLVVGLGLALLLWHNFTV
ncbi:putative sulfate exporter family transporter [Brooklawnia cerclae]|uniref:Integral membrane protein (TIGR00698 family) n=1 Tax=Brooklawnia cerclae TaxID=349934 RepID=A0ABX0SH49_9ACTN|nr:putative sulfate exporter family transporter [Brooklawnia cerclae]NIH57717.1 putative integral membrane protein (TIGR00698 family) [Brooklawnia cerclae]